MATKKVVAKRSSFTSFGNSARQSARQRGVRQACVIHMKSQEIKQAFTSFGNSARHNGATREAYFPTKFSVQDEKFLFQKSFACSNGDSLSAKQSKIGCQLPTADFNTMYSVAPAYSACSSTAGCNFSFILFSSSAITSGFSSSQRLAFSLPCPTRSPL